MFDLTAYFSNPENRDLLAAYFLPENQDFLDEISCENLKIIAENLLSSEVSFHDLAKFPESADENPDLYVRQKESDYRKSYFRYSRIFELCRVLGCKNIYDIGCQRVNQSFLLMKYTTMSYTGISPWGFDLNDYRKSDFKNKNYRACTTNETPKPFCGGRISFFKGYYPKDKFEILPNNIAVACYSLAMLRDEKDIHETVCALKQDFDRVLFNIGYRDDDLISMWKNADWSGFEVCPVGPMGFLFATKHHEDIERMQKVYPFEDGRFITGIDDSNEHLIGGVLITIDPDPFRFYVNW